MGGAVEMDEDPAFQKVAISGPTLASLIQRISASPGDVDGLLFGHVTNSLISSISDDDDPSTSSAAPLISTVTSFITAPTKPSFYSSSGQIDFSSLSRLLDPSSSVTLIGWFSARRHTHPRPSLREFSVSLSLSSISQFRIPLLHPDPPSSAALISPCLFLLFTTPPLPTQAVIHTHEYRAYQFRRRTLSFDPKSIDLVNIGPTFRGHYGNFTPSSPFPLLTCDTRRNPMSEDHHHDRDVQHDFCAQRFEVGTLSRLVGPYASAYTAGLEDLYENMMAKLDSLGRLVETSSSKVVDQENHNMRLRHRVAGLE